MKFQTLFYKSFTFPDKLQHKMFWNKLHSRNPKSWNMINFNIRCFEIQTESTAERQGCWINFNIRCFEICRNYLLYIFPLDKLQHKMFWNLTTMKMDLSDLWDKLQHKMFWNRNFPYSFSSAILINFNIRCFEIFHSSWHP